MRGEEPLDLPCCRGHDWRKRSREVKKQRGKECERCGEHNGKYEHYPIQLHTHHIVKGKHLPLSVARIDANLVVVCERCHGRMEGEPAAKQYEWTGYVDLADTLYLLTLEETIEPTALQTFGFSVFKSYGLLETVRKLRLARRLETGEYQVAPNRLPYDAIEPDRDSLAPAK